jgi:hypothetical protein
VAAIIQYGAQQPLLSAATAVPSTFTTSIASTASLPTLYVESTLSFHNVTSQMKSPLREDPTPRCSSRHGISSLSEYISAWAATVWRTISSGNAKPERAAKPKRPDRRPSRSRNRTSAWENEDPKLREIPQYILDYAPYCWLYSAEEYWPGLMDEHLEHTTPFLDYDPVDEEFQHVDLDNLDSRQPRQPK